MPTYEYQAGGTRVQIQDLVIHESSDLHTDQNRSVVVRSPGTCANFYATINGSVAVEDGAELHVFGVINGSVHVGPGSATIVHKRLNGSVHVSRTAEVRIAPGGIHAGSIHCDGVYVNEGTRGGTQSGFGDVVDAPGSTVRPPDEVTGDGARTYWW